MSRSRSFFAAAFGFSLAVSISGVYIFGVPLAAIVIGSILSRRDGRANSVTPIDVPLAVFFGWALLCTLVARSTSVEQAFSANSAVVLFYLVARGFTAEDVRPTVRWFMVGSAVAGLLAVAQRYSGANYLPGGGEAAAPAWLAAAPHRILRFLSTRDGRSVGTRSHPLTFSEGLIPAFFAGVAFVFDRGASRARRAAAGVAAAIVLGGILASESRGVLLGIGAGVLLMATRLERRTALVLIAAAAVAAAGALAFSPSVRGRLLSVVSAQGGHLADQDSKKIRLVLWAQAAEIIKEHPIAGVGARGVHMVAIDPLTHADRPWTETHDVYLQTAAECGLIGFGLFLWVVALVAAEAWRLEPPWSGAAIGTVAAFLVAGLTESWNRDKEIAFLFWASAGLYTLLARGGRPLETESRLP